MPAPPTEGLSCNFCSVNLGRFSAKVNHHPQTHQVDPYVHWMSYVFHPSLDPELTTILPQLTFFDSWVNLWSSFILAHFFLILNFFKQLCFLMNVMIFFFWAYFFTLWWLEKNLVWIWQKFLSAKQKCNSCHIERMSSY